MTDKHINDMATKMAILFYENTDKIGSVSAMKKVLTEVVLPTVEPVVKFRQVIGLHQKTIPELEAEISANQVENFSVGQHIVDRWMHTIFDKETIYDTDERNDRVAEEIIELTEAFGMTRQDWHIAVDQVYDRDQPVGEPTQEVGGVLITLMALCNAKKIDMSSAFTAELVRCFEKADKIKQKTINKT